MKKLFISADIEGTAGIVNWNETERSMPHDYDYFSNQMTREVAAACEGAHDAGIEEIVVKDAHDSARNLNPAKLPEYARVFRGWARSPLSMMFGLDNTFDGVVFTGYHSAAQMNGNPLSHTMNTQNNYVKVNGILAPELMLNSLIASTMGVPVYCVCGDRGLCEWMNEINPNIATVPTNEGTGAGALTLHPDVAVRRIRETVSEAIATKKKEDLMFPQSEKYHIEVNFKEHFKAYGGGFYPGAKQTGARTVEFECTDWFDAMRFFYFVL
jgi:D-amino peptidase